MARWSTFKWSDGTKWADGIGSITPFTAFIDRSSHRLSIRVTQTTPAGSLAPPAISIISAELGIRAQNIDRYEAFIDRNEHTRWLSIRVEQTGRDTLELLTQDDEPITTQNDESITLLMSDPFTIDVIHSLTKSRSRVQPTR